MVFNLNQFMKKADDDCTIDEMTWPSGSYADMHSRLKGKNCSRGGQHTVVVGASSRYIYVYTPRHKLFKRDKRFPQEGPSEVKRLMDTLNPIIQEEEKADGDKRRQIFESKPCLGMDDHFSGDNICEYIGELGWKSLKTTRRDHLPRGIPKQFLHHQKQVEIGPCSQVARYEQPIVAVKHM